MADLTIKAQLAGVADRTDDVLPAGDSKPALNTAKKPKAPRRDTDRLATTNTSPTKLEKIKGKGGSHLEKRATGRAAVRTRLQQLAPPAPPPLRRLDARLLPAVFNVDVEFPNLFLPSLYRDSGEVPAIDLVPAEEIKQVRENCEKAMYSIFRRLTLPLVSDAGGSPTLVRYFDYVELLLGDVDRDVKIYASGGVVRAAFAYLYDQIYAGMTQEPPVSPEQTLHSLIKGTGDIPGMDIRGVGSDWDILIDSPAGKFEQCKEVCKNLTNSAMLNYLGGKRIDSHINRSIFVVGDIHEYKAQMTRSLANGGSTIDFLTFDVHAGSLIEPDEHRGTINDLLRGIYRYVPPPGLLEDAADTAIRGARPFLELPWIKCADDTHLRQALEKLLAELRAGKRHSERAYGQFDKAMRNARSAGAHNRFYRADKNSIEALILQVAKEVKKARGKTAVPEFVDTFPLHGRAGAKSELKGLPPELLLSRKDFIEHYVPNGVLYHGTQNVENGLAIMRGGLFLSSSSQGMAAFGRGGYTSPSYDFAMRHAGPDGIVFELSVKDDPRLNILDWQAHKDHPAIKAIVDKAKNAGQDPFEILAREHGIDIIINGHVLIQNAAALEFPKDAGDLIQSFASLIHNPQAAPRARCRAYDAYESLYVYASALGRKNLPEPVTLLPLFLELSRRGTLENNDRLYCLEFYYTKWLYKDGADRAGIAAFSAEILSYVKKEDWPLHDRSRALSLYTRFYDECRDKVPGLKHPAVLGEELLYALKDDCAGASAYLESYVDLYQKAQEQGIQGLKPPYAYMDRLLAQLRKSYLYSYNADNACRLYSALYEQSPSKSEAPEPDFVAIESWQRVILQLSADEGAHAIPEACKRFESIYKKIALTQPDVARHHLNTLAADLLRQIPIDSPDIWALKLPLDKYRALVDTARALGIEDLRYPFAFDRNLAAVAQAPSEDPWLHYVAWSSYVALCLEAAGEGRAHELDSSSLRRMLALMAEEKVEFYAMPEYKIISTYAKLYVLLPENQRHDLPSPVFLLNQRLAQGGFNAWQLLDHVFEEGAFSADERWLLYKTPRPDSWTYSRFFATLLESLPGVADKGAFATKVMPDLDHKDGAIRCAAAAILLCLGLSNAKIEAEFHQGFARREQQGNSLLASWVFDALKAKKPSSAALERLLARLLIAPDSPDRAEVVQVLQVLPSVDTEAQRIVVDVVDGRYALVEEWERDFLRKKSEKFRIRDAGWQRDILAVIDAEKDDKKEQARARLFAQVDAHPDLHPLFVELLQRKDVGLYAARALARAPSFLPASLSALREMARKSREKIQNGDKSQQLNLVVAWCAEIEKLFVEKLPRN